METPFELEETENSYIVGIDLGTTNSAVAFVDRTAREPEGRRIRFLEIPQLVSVGEVARRPVLPSFLYLPGRYELPPGSTSLPWNPERTYAVGEFAREQGSLVPGRMVSSAKSWLCHAGVDRTAPILPWGAEPEVEKVSPVEAGARFLLHIRECWDAMIGRKREGCRLEEQLVILTVPASFDEVARELTVEAAKRAGLSRVILVEEPLAAFYAWLHRNEADWQARMRSGQLILVCDVGGGTTDFTVVAVREGEKGLRFDRLAVGDHLMLGGDNMDLTLARHIEAQMTGSSGRIDSRRWHQLTHQCRKAKEAMLGDPRKHPTMDITLVGAGSGLIAGALKGTLTLEKVEELILEGFFPIVPLNDAPKGGRRAGITEWGLPYAQDPAVTRHMAAFWLRFRTLLAQETGRTALFPDYLLFNGGALTPPSIRRRIAEATANWFQSDAGEGWMPEELENPHPELSVAVGAAYYGMVRLGEGVRVGAGSPRAYYARVAGEAESALEPGGNRAVCLISRGTEEGFEAELSEPSFEVLANQPVAFQLLSSSTRLGDRMGDVIADSGEETTLLPPIRTVLRYGKKGAAASIPIRLAVRLTEVGTLELWCDSQQSPHRWQLQFDVRQGTEPAEGASPSLSAAPGGETLDQATVENALARIRAVFEPGKSMEGSPPESLVKDLAALLELRKEKWTMPLIRKIGDTLVECRRGRTVTAQHEARWLNLLGYCLRPGFGDPVDEWRMKEIWKIFPVGLHFQRQPQCRSEWWVFWRRVAGGLSAGRQLRIYQEISPALPLSDKKNRRAAKRLSGQEEIEVWMMLANFERLPVEAKMELGRALLEHIVKGKPKNQELWALSRLGARAPFYGPLDRVISGKEASAWMNALISEHPQPTDSMAHVVVQLALRTGDRERDLPREDIERLSRWLSSTHGAAHFEEILNNPDTALRREEQDWIFGEALPSGLVLTGENLAADDSE